MVTAELIAPRRFRLTEGELAPPAPGEVRVRVGAVGVCGSDLHSYFDGAVGDSPCQFPMVLGHEPAGTVARVGEGAGGWQPGDRVALEPAIYCYHCEYCRAGRYNLCAHLRFLSTPGLPGFFREFVNLPAANLFALPPAISLELGTLVEPLAVALHSLKQAAPAMGESVAVFGAGPIGLLTIACLKLAGAGRIWAVEPVAHRREMAVRMGAAVALDPAEGDAARQIMADSGRGGVDCTLDCAAAGHSLNQAIGAARAGGRVVLTGIHAGALVPVETSPMRRKELALLNVRRSNDECPAALALLASHAAWFAPLVTHSRPLDRIAEAFAIAGAYADGVGKMLVLPG